MAAVLVVLRSCIDGLKSILATQEIGIEYELLCTELSLQWYRIRLWGDSIGLSSGGNKKLEAILSNKPDLETTITQIVNCISYLLGEIELIRRRYEVQPRVVPPSRHGGTLRPARSFNTLSDLPCSSTLRQRMEDNQQQKSYLEIAKWTIRDAKKFEQMVRQLKGIIDGLEQISQASGIARPSRPHRLASTSTTQEENPPPYTPLASISPMAQAISSAVQSASRMSTPSAPTSASDSDLNRHYAELKSHLYRIDPPEEVVARNDRMPLARLNVNQFTELREDVYDEAVRRKSLAEPFLPPKVSYHPKRNLARQKIAGLKETRFADLVVDVVLELERRFSFLRESDEQANNSYTGAYSSSHDSSSAGEGLSTFFISEPEQNTPSQSSSSATVRPSSATSSSPRAVNAIQSPSNPFSTPIEASLRISITDPVWKVLPLFLRIYKIKSSWLEFELWVEWGEKNSLGKREQRSLGMDEKPLEVFKVLDKRGLEPHFALKKIKERENSATHVQAVQFA